MKGAYMTEALMHTIQLWLIAGLVVLQLAILYRFKGLYRKLNWWRKKALATNNTLRNVSYKLNDVLQKKGDSSN
jgi:hypothetical protein